MADITHHITVIAGAGHAGGELAAALRQGGYAGRILLVGEEPVLPYQRPPLSKGFLSGKATLESLFLRPPATYEQARIEFMPNVRIDTIDRVAKIVGLSDGRSQPYDKLVLATGGRPRQLCVAGAEGIAKLANHHVIRSIADIEHLRPQMQAGLRLVIVGGGYIGLEVAAVAVRQGLRVTVLEAMERVLARVTAPEISDFYQTVHRAEGVDIRLGVAVSRIELDASGDAIAALMCRHSDSGEEERVAADIVIVGIGLVPNVELAQQAGLAVDNGILVDEFGLSSDPDILAAGDCANHYNAVAGRRLRLESVPNAVEQARTAAATICGIERPYNPVPWFWSDQYELKLQMVGLSQGYDRIVLRGEPAKRSFTAFYLKDGYVIAADAVSRPQEFMLAKRLVGERIRISPLLLADESQPLKSLMQPA
jgi:3-phenylpropionate/trans-cinnamate dioxygenase ferredoxin reductase subunit